MNKDQLRDEMQQVAYDTIRGVSGQQVNEIDYKNALVSKTQEVVDGAYQLGYNAGFEAGKNAPQG